MVVGVHNCDGCLIDGGREEAEGLTAGVCIRLFAWGGLRCCVLWCRVCVCVCVCVLSVYVYITSQHQN